LSNKVILEYKKKVSVNIAKIEFYRK